jgi:hypothetical protein
MLKKGLDRLYETALLNSPDVISIHLSYFRMFKRLLNLRAPRTINEKICWRKLYQHDPLYIVYADKLKVKNKIADLIGRDHVIETLWSGHRPEDIPLHDLEPPYVIKTNHGSGGHIFIRTRSDVDDQFIVQKMHKLLSSSYGRRHREWAYNTISRQILVEPMLLIPGENRPPDDHRFYVYDGVVHFIQVDIDNFGRRRSNVYDRRWNLLPCRIVFPPSDAPLPEPPNLRQMISIAENIASPFDFMRVDLYNVEGGRILFGEATFYPRAGLGKFTPDHWDGIFGEPWNLRIYA